MGFLSGYRVLDLTDERGMFAGYMLAKLGAEVIQVEARRPMGTDGTDTSSFFRSAFAAGKRSFAYDLDSAADREQLLSLVDSADVLIESADPGVMAARGLDWATLQKRNDQLIYISITAFGSSGPKAGYAATELTVWAAGGPLLLTHNGERAPLRVSVPQAFLHASADAADAALIALFARKRTGRGQHVDVSAQASAAQSTLSAVMAAAVGHENYSIRPEPKARPNAAAPKKTLDLSGSGARTGRTKWKVVDGLAEMHLAMGPASGRFTNNLCAWLGEVGALEERFAKWDWVEIPKRIESGEVTDDDLEKVREDVAKFLATKKKEQLTAEAIKRKLLVAPVMTIADLVESKHLAARHFFQAIDEAGQKRLFPGPFAVLDGGAEAFAPATPAPAVGADNEALANELPRTVRPQQGPRPGRPLEGLKVLDLAWVVAGPLIGRTLADFGATVVRVDSSKRIETARVMGPFPGGKFDIQKGALYDNCNAGKLGLALNLASPEGRAVVRDLTAWADVVIESFSPGQMKTWGLGYEELKKIRPGLIMLSTSLMGQSGPYSSIAGFGNIGAAYSGFQNLVGERDQTPIGPFGPYTDYVAPRFSIAILLAALEQRERTGDGCWIDVAQAEAGLQMLGAEIYEYSATGNVFQANGNRDRFMAPHGVFRCAGKDDWIALAIRNDDDWHRFAPLLGEPIANDARFATFAGRQAHEDELEAAIEAWTTPQRGPDVEQLLQARGVPAHVAASSATFVNDVQLAARGHFLRLPHPLMESSIVENTRYTLSDTPGQVTLAAPPFGRDNRKILGELLGYDEARIAALQSGGILV